MAMQKKYRRLILGFCGFLLAIFAAFLSYGTGQAANGTIEGGIFVANLYGYAQPMSLDDTTVALTPDVKTANVQFSNGHLKISNLPAGDYKVTLQYIFKPSIMCTDAQKNAHEELKQLCKDQQNDTKGQPVVFEATVAGGQTTIIGGNGTEITSKKEIVSLQASGGADCSGKGFLTEWVVCPTISFLLGIMDWSVNNFIQPYLAINPLTTTDSTGAESQLYAIWGNIRNFANVIFIGLFFVIIFSQATSVGISNYGIKRLLPRLVLVAIATNLSFFICAFFVDVFNILGAGIASLMISALLNGAPSISGGADIVKTLFGSGPIGNINAIMAGGVLAAPIIFGILCFLIVAVVMIVVAAVAILIRQVFIIFLVILSPLAFIAALLPNTQKYFSKWFDMFSRLLAMYPVIMFLIAACKLASVILTKVNQ